MGALWLAQNGCVMGKCLGFLGNRFTFPERLGQRVGKGGPERCCGLRGAVRGGG